jgi:glycosyltransferase involved in cell wall biosynthesis
MKIFFIAPQAPHYRETFYRKIIQKYNGHECMVIDGEKSFDDGRPTQYKNFDFPHKRFKENIRSVGPFLLRNYEGLIDFIKKEKPDIIICQSIPGVKAYRQIALMARKNKVKLIMWSCLWEHSKVKRHPLRVLKNYIAKKYLNSAHYHIAYSSYAKNKLLKFGYPAENIFIAYNGIEIDNMEPITDKRRDDLMQQLRIENIDHKFLYVGGLGEDKNVILLLKAVNILKLKYSSKKLKVIIVGDGPEMNSLKTYSAENDLEDYVTFTGRIIHGVDDYFQISDCVVLPGAGGLALNQGLYWKKPCIVSHADGTEEDLIIKDFTGFRFKENDYQSLAFSMESFCKASYETIAYFGENGHKIIVERSNVNKMVETFESVINLLLSEKQQ